MHKTVIAVSLIAVFCAPMVAGYEKLPLTVLAAALITGSGSTSMDYEVDEAATGGLVSRGLATAEGAVTYFIDFEHGKDRNPGTSPRRPWKTFKNVNDGRLFKPGDHILLEANSIWNGASVTSGNYRTLLKSGKAGMFAPHGSGEPDKPIVLDLYEVVWPVPYGPKKPVIVQFKANKRPIINGNGTPAPDYSDNPYENSGAVTLVDVHDWEVRNIECTNTFASDWENPASNHWYRREVPKSLCGILLTVNKAEDVPNVLIENCYAHDVQSNHNNNGNNTLQSGETQGVPGYFPAGNPHPGKGNGGIIAISATGLRLEGNIVRRVGLEGLRTTGGTNRPNVTIKGNFIETVAGDGIVIARVSSNGLVESNIVKDACAAPNLGGGNYASNWAYTVNKSVFRYNEGYGTRYGYLDGEAWDVDDGCSEVIYEYNYSHFNSGGCCLFMGGQNDSVFRYNISANDGGGTRLLIEYSDFDDYSRAIWESTATYQNWTKGQTTFHYTIKESSGANCPLIYNNTFYLGPNATVGLFGHNDGDIPSKNYVRFVNNIVLKERENTGDTSRFTTTSSGWVGNAAGANFEGYITSPDNVRNNIFWAYISGTPGTNVPDAFYNGSAGMGHIIGQNGNKSVNPGLLIQQNSAARMQAERQRKTRLPDNVYNDAAKLVEFTGRKRLQARASLYAPANAASVSGGMATPKQASLVGGWNNCDEVTEDFFGNPVNAGSPPIGAAAAPNPAENTDPWDSLWKPR